ncbi:Zn-ribbon domain-containing protein [Halorientalis salina]|uniref:Zn-ribbon domain-containing protein n=1 Tax=Halorientalis salina TaxID=2932266 RepID=UPI0010AC5EEF|nr:Zn-ribbon containing protein [Halorientalis salina]
MPHQCTNCGRAFADGSKEMLSGCPDCGGNKFQFHPSETDASDDPDPSAEPPDPPAPESSVARTVGSAAATVRNLVGNSGTGAPDPDPQTPEETPAAPTGPESRSAPEANLPSTEDTAQSNARSEVVSPDEIPTGGWNPTDDTDAGSPDAATLSPNGSSTETDTGEERSAEDAGEDRPDLTELREELNDQFESIKVLNPGQYELNLMELYDREEYIIALQEDGRYTIQVPETWHE